MGLRLLDTGILIGLVRGAEWAAHARGGHKRGDAPAEAYTSVICHGELMAFAEKKRWGKRRQDAMRILLLEVPALDINTPDVLRAYASIGAWTEGHPVTAPRQAPSPKPARPMAQNDMWIAATAHAYEATLVTTDKDFMHCADVWFPLRLVGQS